MKTQEFTPWEPLPDQDRQLLKAVALIVSAQVQGHMRDETKHWKLLGGLADRLAEAMASGQSELVRQGEVFLLANKKGEADSASAWLKNYWPAMVDRKWPQIEPMVIKAVRDAGLAKYAVPQRHKTGPKQTDSVYYTLKLKDLPKAEGEALEEDLIGQAAAPEDRTEEEAQSQPEAEPPVEKVGQTDPEGLEGISKSGDAEQARCDGCAEPGGEGASDVAPTEGEARAEGGATSAGEDAPGDTENGGNSSGAVVYEQDLQPQLSKLGKLLLGKGRKSTVGLRLAIAALLAGYFLLLGLASWAISYTMLRSTKPLSGQDVLLFGLMVVGPWWALRRMNQWEDFMRRQITMAADWMLKWKEHSVTVELTKQQDEDEDKTIILARYTAPCGLCKGRLYLERGGREFGWRVIGRCNRGSQDHVYSFDKETKLGYPLLQRKGGYAGQ